MTDWSSDFLVMLYDMRSPFGLAFFTRLTEFGGTGVIVVVLVVAAFVLWRGNRWAHALGLIVTLCGSIATSMFLKNVLQFSRPDLILHGVVENGYGFPSNHSTASMALYGFLMWTVAELHPRWKTQSIVFFSLLILGIGFSRLYLGVHFPADVFGGYLLGFIFVVIGVRVTQKLEAFENPSSLFKKSPQ